jgi:hypothetical protein
MNYPVVPDKYMYFHQIVMSDLTNFGFNDNELTLIRNFAETNKVNVKPTIIGRVNDDNFFFNGGKNSLPLRFVQNEVYFTKLDGRLKPAPPASRGSTGAAGVDVKSKKRMRRRSSKRIKKTKGRRPRNRRL